jgi:thiamine-monophosphate kinase
VSAHEPHDESAEERLIARYFRPLAHQPGALSLEDDAAFYTPPAGYDLVITKDAIVAGSHFFETDPPDTIGRKALRVNLSDLAAKGAEPAGFLLALGLPDVDEDWLKHFARGLAEDAKAYAFPLLGGDTVHTKGPLFLSVTALGIVPHGTMVRRRGARAGDIVMVTGTIGDAAIGLRLQSGGVGNEWKLHTDTTRHLIGRFLLPQPRNALAPAIRHHASAAMDVSDGLVGDLTKLCRVSGVSATVETPRIPVSPAAREALAADGNLFAAMLTGGDDYELVFTLPPDRVAALQADAQAAGVAVTVIGRIEAGTHAPRFLDTGGKPLYFGRGSFSHF